MWLKPKMFWLCFTKILNQAFSTWLIHLTLRFLYILGCSGPRWAGSLNGKEKLLHTTYYIMGPKKLCNRIFKSLRKLYFTRFIGFLLPGIKTAPNDWLNPSKIQFRISQKATKFDQNFQLICRFNFKLIAFFSKNLDLLRKYELM